MIEEKEEIQDDWEFWLEQMGEWILVPHIQMGKTYCKGTGLVREMDRNQNLGWTKLNKSDILVR